jgi:hypothetical protein
MSVWQKAAQRVRLWSVDDANEFEDRYQKQKACRHRQAFCFYADV